MDSVTVEFQRFGVETGILRPSDRYIRTVGTAAPAEEVQFKLDQAVIDGGMETLGYGLFDGPGDPGKIVEVAEKFIADIKAYLSDLLPMKALPGHGDGLYQVEVVTRALELAQLPFEALETPEMVITRRIRQAWPPPPINHAHQPRVLFAWAEPRKRHGSTSRMEVPHERQRKLIDELLVDWGGFDSNVATELANVTAERLAEKMADEKEGFTHVYLLAHGIGPPPRDPNEPFNLELESRPTAYLALEDEDGNLDRCSPAQLGEMFGDNVTRPASFVIATCHGGSVKPVSSGGTLAHALHAAGIPVVLASQLALTQAGSDELISTFLRMMIDGDDPRQALSACRKRLRDNSSETYYDHIALVGYVHIDEGLEQRLPQRKFKVALARLKAASRYAEQRVQKLLERLDRGGEQLTAELRDEASEAAGRFAKVREQLAAYQPDTPLSNEQREELYGLQASSLKREAEAAWNLSQALAEPAAKTWRKTSRDALRKAAEAYARAARWSRDNHWSWVQWLSLESVVNGTLTGHEEDWIVARAAARDAADRIIAEDASEPERKEIMKEAIWASGSLMELCLLAPLIGRTIEPDEAKKQLGRLVAGCTETGDYFPISSTLDQLNRYASWWGEDPHWSLPAEIIRHAGELHSYLEKLSKGHQR